MFRKKKCPTCGLKKWKSEFSKSKRDGLASECKECANVRNQAYYKTKDGIVVRIYGNQRLSSKERGHKPPTYSRESLGDWLFSQELFHELFDEWQNSEYETYLKPSVDRINDSKGYTMRNIQLMTWGENKAKGAKDKEKAVIQFTKNGQFIDEYPSTHEASRQTGIDQSSISKVCLGKANSTGGFIWKYKNY